MRNAVCKKSNIIFINFCRYRCNKIGKVYSLEYTGIPKMFFTPHHASDCYTNVMQGHCCTTMCSMTLGHSCTTVATRMVKSLLSSCLVAKAGERWPAG
jgi:hypothetical protein